MSRATVRAAHHGQKNLTTMSSQLLTPVDCTSRVLLDHSEARCTGPFWSRRPLYDGWQTARFGNHQKSSCSQTTIEAPPASQSTSQADVPRMLRYSWQNWGCNSCNFCLRFTPPNQSDIGHTCSCKLEISVDGLSAAGITYFDPLQFDVGFRCPTLASHFGEHHCSCS